MINSLFKISLIGMLSFISFNNLFCQSSLCQIDNLLVGCPDPEDPTDYLLMSDDDNIYKIRVTFLELNQGLVSVSECNQVIDILNDEFGLSSGISFVWDRKIEVTI